MAASGIIFILYVLAHMYGNLKAFSGHDAYNEYAEHLRDPRRADAPARGFALDHARGPDRRAGRARRTAAAALWRRARQARTTQYVMKKNIAVEPLVAD